MAGTGNTSIRSYNFFVGATVVTGGYAANEHIFIDADDGTNFTSKTVIFFNDSGNTIDIRFSPDPGGGAPHMRALANEPVTLDFKRAKRIYLSGANGSAFRIHAY
jgi:hypothetical protein